MTIDQLCSKARRLKGRPILTLRGVPFQVGLSGQTLQFLTSTTKKWRNQAPKSTLAFLDEWNKTRNTSPGHYTELTRNASYLFALIAAEEPAT